MGAEDGFHGVVPQNRDGTGKRHPDGRFVKGQSGNPGGRPRGLVQRIREHNLPEDAFKWYLDLRKYGSVPHGGFGMGIERAVAWICGLEHVRETIPFPRMLYRLYP